MSMIEIANRMSDQFDRQRSSRALAIANATRSWPVWFIDSIADKREQVRLDDAFKAFHDARKDERKPIQWQFYIAWGLLCLLGLATTGFIGWAVVKAFLR